MFLSKAWYFAQMAYVSFKLDSFPTFQLPVRYGNSMTPVFEAAQEWSLGQWAETPVKCQHGLCQHCRDPRALTADTFALR